MKNIFAICLLCLFFFNLSAQKKKRKNPNSLEAKISTMKAYEGYMDFYYDQDKGKIYLLPDTLNQEFLYVNSLAAGIGSNDIGLDRNKLGNSRVVKLQRFGDKVLLTEPNYRYRASSANPAERKAVQDAFAQSVLWGFKIVKEEDGQLLLDATDFFLRDAFGVAERLKSIKQGTYKLDDSRSAIYTDNTKNFPKNSEFEAILTFKGDADGGYIRSVTPTPSSVTVRQHHSFVELPDEDYEPRVFDPRAGYFSMSYFDYATPVHEQIQKRFITRHRLEKKDPTAAISEPVEPIIYYLDPGTPEPIASALIDGAQWWNQAFEAIGYKDAFQVKMLPEGADPLDVRYNMINWVHRSTRGWSYGSAVTDPRTGEIIKGHVLLGSLRVRQDFLIAEGLLAPYTSDSIPNEMTEMALARLRQLSAHEVGHTLGLSHSYSSSSEGRASVMDYPHPLAEIKDGKIDLGNAYDDKIGAWDKVAIAYGYQDFPEEANVEEELEEIIMKSLEEGLTFITDEDARPQGGAHPYAHLWDNGKDAHEELKRVLEVRKIALKNFGENNIRDGVPYAYLEEVLVPIYFFHRYQTEAAVKLIGGLNYRYALKGDGQPVTKLVDPKKQEKALDALLLTLSPEHLTLPEDILSIIPPRPMGYERSPEVVNIRTGLTFDPIATAEAAADLTISLLLHPARTGRLIEHKARDSRQPGLQSVMDVVLDNTWNSPRKEGLKGEVQRTVEMVLLNNMFKLARDNDASTQVKAIMTYYIDELKGWIRNELDKSNTDQQEAHLAYALSEIEKFEENPEDYEIPEALDPPAGSPIGCN